MKELVSNMFKFLQYHFSFLTLHDKLNILKKICYYFFMD